MQNRQNEPNTQAFKRQKFSFKDFASLITKVKPHFWLLLEGLLLGIISTGMNLVVPKVAAKLVNQLGHTVDTSLVVLVIVLFVFGAIINAASGSALGFFGEDVVNKLRKFLWDKILKLPVSYFDDTKSGEITSRLVNDTSQVKDLLANSMPSMVTSILQLVGALVLMLTMDWKMTLLMFISVPLVTLCIISITSLSRKIAHTRQDALASFNGEVSETLGEIRLVKSSTAEEAERTSGDKDINKLYRIGLKEAVHDSVAGPVMQMVMMGMMIGMLIYGASRVANGSMTFGTLISFLMYLVQMIGPFTMLGQFFTAMAKASGSTARIQELLAVDEEVQNQGKTVVAQGQTLAVKHVDFGYEHGKSILKDVSFTAKPNTVIAFAGPSGGGKTTIFSLLERYYKPTGGKITIGNTNIEDINLNNWRQQIGIVGQDAPVMSGSIRYNLTYGLKKRYTDEQLWQVLEMAYAKEFVEKMDDRLDTTVGERGG